MTPEYVIAAVGANFGWGSAGKICAILAEFCKLDTGALPVIVGTELGRTVVAGDGRWHVEHSDYRTWLDSPDRSALCAALVVGDPDAAAEFGNRGLPVVYVDSLPYLWNDNDTVATDVSVYCAQSSPLMQSAEMGPLKHVTNLVWVESIVAEYSSAVTRVSDLAVVNLGGLGSPFAENSYSQYLNLVLTPAVRALVDCGFTRIAVCGNVPADALRDLPSGASQLDVGHRPHREFLELVESASVLVTSPGLTTILEAGCRRTPTVLLPPQNVSQILNGNMFMKSMPAELNVRWPRQILNPDHALNELTNGGEPAGLAYVYGAIRSASTKEVDALSLWLRQRIHRAVEATKNNAYEDELTICGTAGAFQVASELARVVRDAYEASNVPKSAYDLPVSSPTDMGDDR